MPVIIFSLTNLVRFYAYETLCIVDIKFYANNTAGGIAMAEVIVHQDTEKPQITINPTPLAVIFLRSLTFCFLIIYLN